jgi:hypothetical protein
MRKSSFGILAPVGKPGGARGAEVPADKVIQL